MLIYLIRHGKAGEPEALPSLDRVRPLTPEGRSQFREAAQGLGKLGIEVKRIYTSPYARCVQTAAILHRNLPGSLKPVEAEELGDEGSPKDWFRVFHGERSPLALVGHGPPLDYFIELSTGKQEKMKKGGAALVQFKDKVKEEEGKLLWLFTQKELREIAKED